MTQSTTEKTMTRKERLAALDRAGELLKQIGEDFSIRFRRADSMIPRDRFTVTVECPGKPFGIVASADTATGALIKALAEKSDKLAEIAIRDEIEARVRAEMRRRAA